jgi:hypothetical protein
MRGIGEALHEARRRAGMSLSELSARTRLRPAGSGPSRRSGSTRWTPSDRTEGGSPDGCAKAHPTSLHMRTNKKRGGKRRPSHCRAAISRLMMRRAGRVVSRARTRTPGRPGRASEAARSLQAGRRGLPSRDMCIGWSRGHG